MNDKKKYIIRCRGIIMHEGKLLLVRHPHDTSFAALPGGHLEWEEDVLQCVEREIIEELGVKPIIGRLLYVNTFIDGTDIQPMEFFFEIVNGADYVGVELQEREEDHELDEVFWAGPEDADTIRILPEQIGKDLKSGALLSDTVRYIRG